MRGEKGKKSEALTRGDPSLGGMEFPDLAVPQIMFQFQVDSDSEH